MACKAEVCISSFKIEEKLVSLLLWQIKKLNYRRPNAIKHFVDLFPRRNRLSPCFINKAATVKPIQCGEENLLESRSKKNEKEHREPKVATKTLTRRTRVESGLHNDAPKRETTQCVAAVETTRSRGFTRSRTAGRIPPTMPPRGFDTSRHCRHWHRDAKISPGSIRTPHPITQVLAVPKLGVPNTV
jgi:hypothetical protein